MQTLNLTKRPAKIGKSVNTRTEMHGEEEVPGQDIPLSGIVLSNLELAAVTDEESAGTGFFKMDGDQYVPRIAALDPQTISHRFTGALVRMSGGGVKATMYTNAKIKGIVLVPQTGGLTLMSCTLQVNPRDDDPSAQALINRKISISIKAELETEKPDDESTDPELPLDHQDAPGDGVPLSGLGEPPSNPDVDETMSHMGRKIQQHARKSKKK
jgi:hypothetical protein